MPQLTKEGAQQFTDRLDSVASEIQTNAENWGVPQRIAQDFAYRCDLLSDALEKMAGVERQALTEYDPVDESKTGWDPEGIGEEVGGPQRQEPDEPYMNAEFTQQENRELRERQEGGDLGMTPNLEEQTPTPGRQAAEEASDLEQSIDRLTKQATDAQLRVLGDLEDSLKVSSAQLDLVGGGLSVSETVKKLATSIGVARDLLIQAGAHGFAGPVVIDESERIAVAVNEVLPYVTKLTDSLRESKTSSSPTAQLRSQEIVEASTDRIGRLIGLAVKIADDCSGKISASVTSLTKEEAAA